MQFSSVPHISDIIIVIIIIITSIIILILSIIIILTIQILSFAKQAAVLGRRHKICQQRNKTRLESVPANSTQLVPLLACLRRRMPPLSPSWWRWSVSLQLYHYDDDDDYHYHYNDPCHPHLQLYLRCAQSLKIIIIIINIIHGYCTHNMRRKPVDT